MKLTRIFSLLLVLAMASTALFGGTVARYNTSDAADASAQVAKWGIVLKVDGNLFGVKYKDATNGNQASADDTNISVSSAAATPATVVAPGTKNDTGISISLTGKSETKVQVDMTVKTRNIFLAAGSYGVMVEDTSITAANYAAVKASLFVESGDAYVPAPADFNPLTTYYSLKDAAVIADTYYPVVYKADGATDVVGTVADDMLAEIAEAYTAAVSGVAATPTDGTGLDLNKKIYTTSKVFDVNKDLSELNLSGESITWEWTFDATNDAHDDADTILGNLIAPLNANGTVVKLNTGSYVALVENTDYSVNTSFEISIAVTQID